jgi:hypothetical protein
VKAERKMPDLLMFLTEAAEYIKELQAREEALRSFTADSVESLKALADGMTGEQKVALVEAMGFTPMGSDHQDDCIRYTHGRGFRCNCVPPATVWNQPHDVNVYRKQTWEDRKALAHQWSREGTHGREKEED